MDHGEIGLPDKECLFGFPSALTYQLRAGADNGTLTAQLEQNIVMAIGGGDTMWVLPSVLNVKVMKFNRAWSSGGINYGSLKVAKCLVT